jgi:predicted molibdopterin-dependent oxidoreductase YjgC
MQSTIAEIGKAKTIVSVGIDVDDYAPVVWLRVYKAISKNGAKYFRNDDITSQPVADAIAAGTGTIVLAGASLSNADAESLKKACAASGAKLNILLPESNSWGAITMGVLPDRLPYQHSVSNGARPQFETLWGSTLPAEAGLDTAGILQAAADGKIKVLYIMGVDVVTSFPDQDLARRALDRVPFLIVQDLFMTETAKYADVFLPACSYIEKDGSFTNIEGRVQTFRKAIEPRGQSRPDWQILAEMMVRLGKQVPYFSPRDIAREIARTSQTSVVTAEPQTSN